MSGIINPPPSFRDSNGNVVSGFDILMTGTGATQPLMIAPNEISFDNLYTLATDGTNDRAIDSTVIPSLPNGITFEGWCDFPAAPASTDCMLSISNSVNSSVQFQYDSSGRLTWNQTGTVSSALSVGIHHFAFTWENVGSNNFNIYIDGVLDVTGNFTYVNLGTAPSPASLVYLFVQRSTAASYSQHFKAEVDRWNIWDSALNATEINARKSVKYSAPASGMVRGYNFDDNIDLSGGGALNELVGNTCVTENFTSNAFTSGKLF